MTVITRRWTADEFQKAADLGLFGTDTDLELIDGEITKPMSPQNSPHSTAIRAVEEALRAAFRRGYDIRVQMPLSVSPTSRPEPDIAVVRGTWRDYEEAHPETGALVVEISDATLASDRATKASLYAGAGVGEFWIVNLQDRLLEVHTDPSPLSEQPFGYGYRTIRRLPDTDTVTPILTPGVIIPISELMPRRKPIPTASAPSP